MIVLIYSLIYSTTVVNSNSGSLFLKSDNTEFMINYVTASTTWNMCRVNVSTKAGIINSKSINNMYRFYPDSTFVKAIAVYSTSATSFHISKFTYGAGAETWNSNLICDAAS